MNEKQIECFTAVVETMSFSKASEALFMSQPSISYQIKTLEQELDVVLFERSTTKIKLTSAGKDFYEEAVKLRAVFSMAINRMRRHRQKKSFMLGFPFILVTMDNHRYTGLMKRLYERFPSYTFETVIAKKPPEGIRQLRDGEVDLIVMAADKELATDHTLCSRHLHDADIYVMISKKHPLAAQKSIKLSELEGENVFVIEEDSALIPMITERLKRDDLQFTYVQKKLFESAMPLIDMRKGITFTSQTKHHLKQVLCIPVEDFARIPISVAWLKKNETKDLMDIAGMVAKIREIGD